MREEVIRSMATMSIAPTSHITPDNDVVVAEIFIAAPRERIFQALINPDQAVRWWGQSDKYRLSEFQMDVRVGGKWSCSGSSLQIGAITIPSELLQSYHPRRRPYSSISTLVPLSSNGLS